MSGPFQCRAPTNTAKSSLQNVHAALVLRCAANVLESLLGRPVLCIAAGSEGRLSRALSKYLTPCCSLYGMGVSMKCVGVSVAMKVPFCCIREEVRLWLEYNVPRYVGRFRANGSFKQKSF